MRPSQVHAFSKASERSLPRAVKGFPLANQRLEAVGQEAAQRSPFFCGKHTGIATGIVNSTSGTGGG
jgi:hypothetical protein